MKCNTLSKDITGFHFSLQISVNGYSYKYKDGKCILKRKYWNDEPCTDPDIQCPSFQIIHQYCFPVCETLGDIVVVGIDEKTFCSSSCPSNFYLNGTICIEGNQCPRGTYKDLRQREMCQFCEEDCDRCSGFGDEKCTQCAYFEEEGHCVKQCSAGLVHDEYYCMKKCAETSFQFEETCVEKCPTNTYATASHICEKCDILCDKCSGPSEEDCIICKGVLFGPKCINECPSSHPYIKNGTCTSDCDLLKFGNECVHRCPDSSYIAGDTCVSQCPHSLPYTTNQTCTATCDTFYLHMKCVYECPRFMVSYDKHCRSTCPPEAPIPDPDTRECDVICHKIQYHSECIYQCPVSSFQHGNTCEPCHADCYESLGCTGPYRDNCTLCPENKVGYMKHCVNECPADAPFPDPITRECNKDCYQILYQGKCISKCPVSTYQHRNSCLPCHQDCFETAGCTGPGHSNCTTCDPVLSAEGQVISCKEPCPNEQPYHINETCVSKCPDSKQFDYSKVCYVVCPTGTFLVPHSYNCVTVCPQNMQYAKCSVSFYGNYDHKQTKNFCMERCQWAHLFGVMYSYDGDNNSPTNECEIYTQNETFGISSEMVGKQCIDYDTACIGICHSKYAYTQTGIAFGCLFLGILTMGMYCWLMGGLRDPPIHVVEELLRQPEVDDDMVRITTDLNINLQK